MKIVLTPEQMRESERRCIESTGTTGLELMERAAAGLADAIAARLGGSEVIIACGSGGNGGDGLAAARLLRQKGFRARVLLTREPTHADAQVNYRRLRDMNVPVLGPEALPTLAEPDLWCDALFGTGLSRAPSGAEADIIGRMNASPAPVIAADVPSGLDALTGKAFTPTVRAEQTVCFGALKAGLVLNDGLDACGEISIVDIGLPEGAQPVRLLEREDAYRLLKPRPRNMHKGTAGRLLLIAGSRGMAGAAAIAASAALRTGVGLVTIACPERCLNILQALAPCATCLPLPEEDGAVSNEALPMLMPALESASALAIGPGVSRRAGKDILRAALECGLPAVIDADALNILSENPDLKALLRPHHVITPHPGEAQRLLGALSGDPLADARALAGLGATALFKGASTVICAGDAAYISASGCSGMARGGSGDALTGILGALLAEGLHPDTPAEARFPLTAALASELHGLAGEAAADAHTARGMTAMDIALHLEDVFRDAP